VWFYDEIGELMRIFLTWRDKTAPSWCDVKDKITETVL
jgi:hypothetical protein